MRPIKFRAWDKKERKMFIPIGYSFIDGYLTCIIEDKKTMQNNVTEHLDETWYDEYREADYGVELMQFTGLLDKNGKEIYESDVIRWTWPSEEIEGGADIRSDYKVFWSEKEASFMAEYLGRKVKTQSVGFNSKYAEDLKPELELEVIGNIYENEELLGKEE